MNVLFFNPWQLVSLNTREHVAPSWPIGLLYVAATTIAAGHNVSIIDAFMDGCIPNRFYGMHNVSYEGTSSGAALLVGASGKIISILTKKYAQPDVIGISLPFSSQHTLVPYIIEAIKSAAPDATLVFGGGHATIAADALLAIDGVDYVIRGEGEVA